MHGEYKMPGGKLVVIDLEIQAGKLANVQLSGDFFLEPDGVLHMIDGALNGLDVDLSHAAMTCAIEAAIPDTAMLYGISPDAVATAVQRALHGEHGA
jgi:lipoate-protein ligase A